MANWAGKILSRDFMQIAGEYHAKQSMPPEKPGGLFPLPNELRHPLLDTVLFS